METDRTQQRLGRAELGARPQSFSVRHTSKRQLEVIRADGDDRPWLPRPVTRGDCVDGIRPCPFAACRHSLLIEVTGRGTLKLNFPDLEPSELAETCALDVADQGSQTLEHVGRLMNITRERLRQLEEMAIQAAARSEEFPPLYEFNGLTGVRGQTVGELMQEQAPYKSLSHRNDNETD